MEEEWEVQAGSAEMGLAEAVAEGEPAKMAVGGAAASDAVLPPGKQERWLGVICKAKPLVHPWPNAPPAVMLCDATACIEALNTGVSHRRIACCRCLLLEGPSTWNPLL